MRTRTLHRGSPQALRESNKRLLLDLLLDAPDGLTRPELARSLSLTVTAIANLVAGDGDSLAAVLDESPADAHSQRAGSSGPTPKVVQLKPDLGYAVGIAFGRTRIRVAFADLLGTFDSERDERTAAWDVENDLHGALAHAATTTYELVTAHGVQPEEISAIGFSIPAPVTVALGPGPTDRRGNFRDLGFGSFVQWANLDPIAALTNHLAALPEGQRWSAIELHVDNDANLGALAELKLGAGRGKQNVLYILIEEGGVGAGLIFDGRNYRGTGGIAGELGHIVVHPDRPERCAHCGRPCVEAITLTKFGWHPTDVGKRVSLKRIVQNALDGDQEAIAAIRDAADYLGQAVAPLVTVLNFDRILLGGPFPAQAYGLVIPPLQTALARLTIDPAVRDYVVELGALADDASLRGAICLALQRTRIDYLLNKASGASAAASAQSTIRADE